MWDYHSAVQWSWPQIWQTNQLPVFTTSKWLSSLNLYIGVRHCLFSWTRLLQNAVAKLFTGTKMREHITPVLIQSIGFSLFVFLEFFFVCKALNGLVLLYISYFQLAYSSLWLHKDLWGFPHKIKTQGWLGICHLSPLTLERLLEPTYLHPMVFE